MASPELSLSPFEQLPLEILGYIFELAYESELKTPQSLGQPRNPTIFAARDVSRQVRSKTLACRPIWRTASEILLATARQRTPTDLLRSMSLCARYTDDTLRRIDLGQIGIGADVKAASHTSKLCYQQMLDMIQIVSASARSIKELRLPRHLWRWGQNRCHCLDCSRIQYDSSHTRTSAPGPHMALDAAIWQLLRHAKSLELLYLPFSTLTAPEVLEQCAAEMEARPKMLDLLAVTFGPRDAMLPILLGRLASRAERLQLEDFGTGSDSRDTSIRLVPSVIVPVALTLQELQLYGDTDDLDIAEFFQHDYPSLQRLSLDFMSQEDGPDFRPPVVRRRASLPKLSSLEAPAWCFRYLDAPSLRAVAVTHLAREYEDAVILELVRLPSLEDLMLLFWSFEDYEHQYSDHLETSQMLRKILQGLASTAPASALRRLSITNGQFRHPEWLLDAGFVQESLAVDGTDREDQFHKAVEQQFNIEESHCIKKSTYLDHILLYADAPVIGSDLLNLPRSLKTLNVSGCLVEPQVWSTMRATSGCENMSCNPPPFCLEQIFVRDGQWTLNEGDYPFYATLRDISRGARLLDSVREVWTTAER